MTVNTVHFLVHLLCAVTRDSCIPYNPAVKPENGSSNSLQEIPPDSVFPVVHTKSGSIQGYFMKTIRNRPVAAFEGIPYAKPPIGELRFRAPEPIDPWPGIKMAMAPGTICLQLEPLQYYRIYGHEDCLFLNVYSPKVKVKSGEELPVIFYIHGGAHASGSGIFYGPSYLLDKQDIVLVTINYRVGILGFFTTGDQTSPGNYGLKDQALALEWIKNNVKQFGGDPNKITLMGQSSGSASVGLHLMSHKTRSIPWAAILQSGHPLNHWAVVNRTLESSQIVAKSFRCAKGNSEALMKCMRSKNPYFVVEHQWRAYKVRFFPLILFGPIVESESDEAFLTESPEMAYENGNVSKVPILQGIVANEGDFIAGIGFLQQVYGLFRREWLTVGPIALDLDLQDFTSKQAKEKEFTLRDFYFPDNATFTFWTRDWLSQLFGDRFIANGVRKGLEWHSKIAPTYGYIFNYRGVHSTLESLALNREDWGVSHGDGLQYIFNSTLFFQPLKTSDKDFKMVEFITNVWGNFASKRKPIYTNIEGIHFEFWNPISKSGELKILDIDEKRRMISYPLEERYKLWKSLGLKDDFKNSRFEKS